MQGVWSSEEWHGHVGKPNALLSPREAVPALQALRDVLAVPCCACIVAYLFDHYRVTARDRLQ